MSSNKQSKQIPSTMWELIYTAVHRVTDRHLEDYKSLREQLLDIGARHGFNEEQLINAGILETNVVDFEPPKSGVTRETLRKGAEK